MNKRKLPFAACIILLSTICFTAPRLCAQSGLSGAAAPIEMVIVDGNGTERRRSSFDGVMEPVGLPAGVQTAITLQASSNKAGQAVIVSLLDGGEIVASPTLSVANEGTVSFSFRSGQTLGLYRVLVTVGIHQYELQLYAVGPRVGGTVVGP